MSFFRWTYRMTYTTFEELHRLLQPELVKIHKEYQLEAAEKRREKRTWGTTTRQEKRWTRFVPNGKITTRFAIALWYFAGGSLYDLAPLYGVGRTNAFHSVWMVVEAIHRTTVFNLVFPQDHDSQRALAQQFSTRSQAGFDCCVGAVDGIF